MIHILEETIPYFGLLGWLTALVLLIIAIATTRKAIVLRNISDDLSKQLHISSLEKSGLQQDNKVMGAEIRRLRDKADHLEKVRLGMSEVINNREAKIDMLTTELGKQKMKYSSLVKKNDDLIVRNASLARKLKEKAESRPDRDPKTGRFIKRP
jgi:regulator of replication initiation timing